jgi:hypothetical protein
MEKLTHQQILNDNLNWWDIVKHYKPDATDLEISNLYWNCYNKACYKAKTSAPKNCLLLEELEKYIQI